MNKPEKIVSLVPSLTELLFDLGLGDAVAGRTRFCIHPEKEVGGVPIVGGTKNPRLDKIEKISPDLIIANREENRKEDVEKLGNDFDLLLTDIASVEDALLTIHEIGIRCGVRGRADELNRKINEEFQKIPDEPPLQVAYFIWKNPWMSIGKDTYIHSVLSHWNLQNIFENRERYPTVTLDEVAGLNPDFIFLSSEPYPFKEKHKSEIMENCPDTNVLLVDGQWFSWYGSRMLPSFKKLNTFRRAIS